MLTLGSSRTEFPLVSYFSCSGITSQIKLVTHEQVSLTSVIDNFHLLMFMNDTFSLTSFVCWCGRMNKFSLTSIQ